jgi:BirA family biotin operon repressor/biotin-[acetyl-CoA-carboxylase] ligase
VQWLTMIAGLACADAVEAQTALCPALKWPNDLLLRERKLAGILTELETAGNGIVFAVVGLGVNVNVDFGQPDVDPELQHTAIGLSQALGRPVDRLELLDAILTRLEKRYEALDSGVSPHGEWSRRLLTLGRRVQAVVPTSGQRGAAGGERVLEGEAVGVDQYGALLLRLADGRTERVLAGDVSWWER